MKLHWISFAMVLLACNTAPTKTVLVMGRGNIRVQNNAVVMKSGAGYAEKEVDVKNTWKDLQVETADGKQVIEIPDERGYYILNLENDTIVGSYQELGVDLSNENVISQEELKFHIDSLVALTCGKNINFVKNYFCIPGQLLKVSSNIKAKVYGPYKNIPYKFDVGEDMEEPEIYKFYTNSEMRRLISNFKESSIYYLHKETKRRAD